MSLGEKSDLRVLIALENGQAAIGARAVFKEQRAAHIVVADNNRAAMEHMKTTSFNLVLLEDTFPEVGGLDFCRFIRFQNAPVSVAPIMYAIKEPDRKKVIEARDAGVNKMLAMPFTTASLIKNLDSILVQPKPFIRVTGYYGPCRRSGVAPYKGPERRQAQKGVFPFANMQKAFKGL
ncbi:response regulator [Kordiimonas aestuarii]|uniref:response regulator n=1 Tax=Kordiimonas aestuarii TaxID=1005925 RepID=UPI0021CF4D4F|nr:response regulator [Kordiimonas aestuarii]